MEDDTQLSSDKFRVEPLTAHNYFMWSNDMEILLRGKGLWGYVSGDELEPTDRSELQKYRRKNDLALAHIFMTINASCKSSVVTLRNPKVVWDRLATTYQKVSEATIDAMLTRFQTMSMERTESVVNFTNRIDDIVNQLAAIGHSTSDQEKRRALLRGLSRDFLVPAQVIRCSGKTFTEAVSDLVVFECTMERDEPAKAFISKPTRHSSQCTCTHCGRPGHTMDRCWHNPNGSNYREYDPSKNSSNRNRNGRRKGSSHRNGDIQSTNDPANIDKTLEGNKVVINSDSESELAILTVTSAFVSQCDTDSSKWMLDSACTSHICNDKSAFVSIRNNDSKVQVGNHNYVDSTAIGTVILRTIVDGKSRQLRLEDVIYAPEIIYNLISVSKARRNGFKFVVDDDPVNEKRGLLRMTHKDSGKTALIAPETEGGLYEALVSTSRHDRLHTVCATSDNTQPMERLWHRRVGHLSQNVLQKSSPIVTGLPKGLNNLKDPICHSCASGKSIRQPRRTCITSNSMRPLERVFTDIVGPIEPLSLSRARYYITLIDDFSGYSMVKFILRKSQAAEALPEMIKELSSLYEGTIKRLSIMNRAHVKWLRSDGGGEYVSNTLRTWFVNQGITHELTTAYSPESNGKAERLNRTLNEMALSMMQSIGIQNAGPYWAEAVNTANHIRNRLYTKSCRTKKTRMKPSMETCQTYLASVFLDVPLMYISRNLREKRSLNRR